MDMYYWSVTVTSLLIDDVMQWWSVVLFSRTGSFNKSSFPTHLMASHYLTPKNGSVENRRHWY